MDKIIWTNTRIRCYKIYPFERPLGSHCCKTNVANFVDASCCYHDEHNVQLRVSLTLSGEPETQKCEPYITKDLPKHSRYGTHKDGFLKSSTTPNETFNVDLVTSINLADLM